MYFLVLNTLCCLLVSASLVCAQIRTDLRYPPSTGFVHLQQPMNPRHPLARGLENWWRVLLGWFGGPTWYDLVNHSHGTLQNMTTVDMSGWGVTTRPGGVGEMRFDGVDDAVDGGNAGNFTAENFTVSFWIKPLTLSISDLDIDGAFVIVFKGEYQVNGWFIQHAGNGIDQGSIRFSMNQSGVAEDTDSAGGYLQIGTWSFVTCVRNGTQAFIYHNGIETSYVQRPTLTDPALSNSNVALGYYPPITSAFHVNGALDDVRIWSRALSASEVAGVYRESQQGEPTLLTRLLPVALTPVVRSGGFSIFFQGR